MERKKDNGSGVRVVKTGHDFRPLQTRKHPSGRKNPGDARGKTQKTATPVELRFFGKAVRLCAAATEREAERAEANKSQRTRFGNDRVGHGHTAERAHGGRCRFDAAVEAEAADLFCLRNNVESAAAGVLGVEDGVYIPATGTALGSADEGGSVRAGSIEVVESVSLVWSEVEGSRIECAQPAKDRLEGCVEDCHVSGRGAEFGTEVRCHGGR